MKQFDNNSQHKTLSEIPVERIYAPENTDIDYLEDIGFPGEYPLFGVRERGGYEPAL